uniref:Uncharacterized protein n=1 Tax=Candidatus Kentrum sp. UNK TaxID=2126344 RepID=A0A451AFN4_9GAMM|nr:MAG: hypothetical protein BECKUNK1418G_GA0071005_105211 [Candidatus Kentron sp. UNK]VFK71255.1 MAG: hypothetical protein BECKUNK1418H_GA0071006_105711 [Candidatus Kentron sp. UNK]
MVIDQATIDEIKRLRVSEKVLIVEEIGNSIAKGNGHLEYHGSTAHCVDRKKRFMPFRSFRREKMGGYKERLLGE